MYLVNAQQMREMDRFAMEEIGIPSIVLMETAGQSVVQEVEKRYPKAKVLVVAGHGNNGGDAFVIARHLSNRGFAVKTWLVGSEERMTADALTAYRSLIQSRFQVQKLSVGSWDSFCGDTRQAELIIDGVLGTGMRGPLREEVEKVVKEINSRKGLATILSVDIPSGVNADNGEVATESVLADLTVTFACPKWGHYLFPGAAHCGQLIVRDIGIPAWVGEELQLSSRLLQSEEISRLIPARVRHSHKGTYGHVLIISGSQSFVGAPGLAALGAIRSGAGMVTLAIPKSIQPMVAGQVPEAVYWLWPETDGSLSKNSWKVLTERKLAHDFTIVGPGIGKTSGVEWLEEVIRHTSGPLLLDADAINLLARDLSIIKKRDSVILTPHPGEMARLLGSSIQEVEKNRKHVAIEFARKHQVYLLLKGTYPIIATPGGECFVSPRGSSSLAKGGSGDVLSGMIGSFVGQTGNILTGMQCALYVHGMAGEFMDEYSGGASDLGKWIGRALQALSQETVRK